LEKLPSLTSGTNSFISILKAALEICRPYMLTLQRVSSLYAVYRFLNFLGAVTKEQNVLTIQTTVSILSFNARPGHVLTCSDAQNVQ